MTIEQELYSILECIAETSGLVWASEGTAIVHDPDIGVYRGHVADCVEEDDAKAIVQTVKFIRAHGPALLSALADQRRYRKLRTLTPYKIKKIQDSCMADATDTVYFLGDRFDMLMDREIAAQDDVAIVPLDQESE